MRLEETDHMGHAQRSFEENIMHPYCQREETHFFLIVGKYT